MLQAADNANEDAANNPIGNAAVDASSDAVGAGSTTAVGTAPNVVSDDVALKDQGAIETTDSDSLDENIDNMIVAEEIDDTDSTLAPAAGEKSETIANATTVTSSATASDESAAQDDELMREMEAIESGTVAHVAPVTSENVNVTTSAAATTTAGNGADNRSETDIPQSLNSETSDLLADLESGGDSIETPSSAAAAPVNAAKTNDGNSDASNTTTAHSATPTAADDGKEAIEPMDLDETVVVSDGSGKTAPTSDKDEAITSTSTSAEDNPSTESVVATSSSSIVDIAVVVSSSAEGQPDKTNAVAVSTTIVECDDLDASVANATSNADAAISVGDAASAGNTNLDRTLVTPVPTSQPSTGAATVDNKLLTNMILINNGNSSTPNSNPVSAAATPSNVFNSTPIQRQFDISSENVSKIDAAVGDNTTVGDNSSAQDSHHKLATVADGSGSATNSDSSAISQQPAPSSSSSSSDSLTHYAKILKQFNGHDGAPAKSSAVESAVAKMSTVASDDASNEVVLLGGGNASAMANGSSAQLDESVEHSVREADYEISVWYEASEIVYLTVERKVQTTALSTSSDGAESTNDTSPTSNGSVSSVGPFVLPGTTAAAVAANAAHSTASSDSALTASSRSLLQQQQPRTRQTVHGVLALANFMIDHFARIRSDFGGDGAAPTSSAVGQRTPVASSKAAGSGRAPAKKNLSKTVAAGSPNVIGSPSTPTTPASRRNKRTAASSTPSANADDEPTAKKVRGWTIVCMRVF